MHRTSLHYLNDIHEAAGRIKKYTAGMSYEEFSTDPKTQDAVIRNFEIIGEASKNIPQDLKDRYPVVEWRQVAGLRDVMAHRYYRVDLDILWEIIHTKIPALKREIGKILREEK